MQPKPIIDDARPSWLRYDPDAANSPRRLLVLLGVALLLLVIVLWTMSGGDEPAGPAVAPALPLSTPAPAVAPAPPIQPAASSAQIVLHGVMGSAADGAAILSVGGAQRLVRVGRDIVPGLPLVSIGADHIIVRENGQDVRIAFLDSVPASPVASAGGSPRGATRPSDADAARRQAVEYLSGMQAAREGPGYTLRQGRVPPAFAAAGLQAGDTVLRVGGTELESPDDVERIPRELGASEAVEIEITRDGQRRTITVPSR